MAGITTTSTLSAPVQQTLMSRMLSVKQPELIHNIAAMKERLPMHGGTTARFRRYTKLPVNLVPLGNTGATPPPSDLTAVNIDAQMSFYGGWIYLNEQVQLQAQDKPLNEAVRLLGIQLRETEDALTRNMLASSAALINCVGGTNGDTPTEITLSDVDAITRVLLSNDAKKTTNNIQGEDRFGKMCAEVKSSLIDLEAQA